MIRHGCLVVALVMALAVTMANCSAAAKLLKTPKVAGKKAMLSEGVGAIEEAIALHANAGGEKATAENMPVGGGIGGVPGLNGCVWSSSCARFCTLYPPPPPLPLPLPVLAGL